MTPIKMEKYQWINPDNHSIAVDDQKQPVLNENGDLIVLDNESKYRFKRIFFKNCLNTLYYEILLVYTLQRFSFK